nr:MAG TPA: hypothetical protein [Caudoviricetes sp.]
MGVFFSYSNRRSIAQQGKRCLRRLAGRPAGRMLRMNNHPNPAPLGRYRAN